MPLDPNDAARLRNLKVLLVDDEYYMRKVLRTHLLASGVTAVSEAATGVDGLEQIERWAPDVVIVDWQMPKLDGPSFVRYVRSPEHCSTPNVPIIMLTGHSEKSRVMEAIKIGVNDFMLKPVSSQVLQERLLGVLSSPPANVQAGQSDARQARKLMSNLNADGDAATTSLVMLD